MSRMTTPPTQPIRCTECRDGWVEDDFYLCPLCMTKTKIRTSLNPRWAYQLDDFDLDRAIRGGTARYDNAKRNKRDGGKGPSRKYSGPHFHINGAKGELCLSCLLGVPWDETIGKIDRRDVANIIECRTKMPQNLAGELNVKTMTGRGDNAIPTPDGIPYVLMLPITDRKFYARGWMLTDEARTFDEVSGPYRDTAWDVPQEHLHEMETLLEWLKQLRKTGSGVPLVPRDTAGRV